MKTRNAFLIGGITLLSALSTAWAATPPISSSGLNSVQFIGSTLPVQPGVIFLPRPTVTLAASGLGAIPAPAIVQPWPSLPYSTPPTTVGHFQFQASQPGPAPAAGSGTVSFWVTPFRWPLPVPRPQPVLLRIDGSFTTGIWPYAPDGGLVEGSGPAVLSRPGQPPIKGAVTIESFDFEPTPSTPFGTGTFHIEFWLVSPAGFFTQPIYAAEGSVPDSPFGNIEVGFQ